MAKKEFIEKLEKIEFKESIIQNHKAKLKQFLASEMSFSKKSDFKGFKWRELLNIRNPFTMKFFRRSIPIGILAVFTAIFVITQVNFTPTPIVVAREIIRQAMTDLSKLNFPDEKSKKELEFKMKILEEARKSNELEYLGEEKWLNAIEVKKIRFRDKDLPTDLTIFIGPKGSFLGEVYFEFKDQQYLPFEVLHGEFRDSKIVNKEALISKLKDPTIEKQWVKDLIRWNNEKCLEKPYQTTDQEKITKMVSGKTEDHFKLDEEFKSLIPSSEVVFIGCSPSYGYTSYDGKGKLNLFSISFYSLGNQKKKLAEAQNIVEEMIQKLSAESKTEENKLKIEMLKRAKSSTMLRHQEWRDNAEENFNGSSKINLNFKDSQIASSPIEITISKEQAGKPMAEFRFRPDYNSNETKVVSSVIEGKIEQGKVLKLEQFKDKELVKNPLRDLIVKVIVEPQNKKWFEELKQRENLPKNFNEVFEAIVRTSEVLILDDPYYSLEQGDDGSKDGQINGYALRTYSFGLAKKYDQNPEEFKINPTAIIEEATKKIAQFNSSEARLKLEVLKQLRKIHNLRYDGEELFPHKNGKYFSVSFGLPHQTFLMKKFKRYSANFDLGGENANSYLSILIDPNDTSENFLHFEHPFFGEREVKSIQGKVFKGKVTNVAEITTELASVEPLPEWVKYLVRVNNEKWLQAQLVPTAQCYDTAALVKQLKVSIEKAEVMVSDLICPGIMEKESTEFILSTYSLL